MTAFARKLSQRSSSIGHIEDSLQTHFSPEISQLIDWPMLQHTNLSFVQAYPTQLPSELVCCALIDICMPIMGIFETIAKHT